MSDRSAMIAALLCALVAPAPAFAAIRVLEIVTDGSGGGGASPKSAAALCPAGTELVGGGARASAPLGLRQQASRTLLDAGSGEAIGWEAQHAEIYADSLDWGVTAVALCGHARGLEPASAVSAIDSSNKSVDVVCPPGKSALGGGFDVVGATPGVAVRTTAPILDETSGAPIGWTVGAYEEIPSADLWLLRAEVRCADEAVLVFQAREPYSNEQLSGLDLLCPQGWVATGGGVRGIGLLADWTNWSAPSPEADGWTQRLTRAEGVTASAEREYFVVCPEPGASASALAALGVCLAPAGRRRIERRNESGSRSARRAGREPLDCASRD